MVPRQFPLRSEGGDVELDAVLREEATKLDDVLPRERHAADGVLRWACFDRRVPGGLEVWLVVRPSSRTPYRRTRRRGAYLPDSRPRNRHARTNCRALFPAAATPPTNHPAIIPLTPPILARRSGGSPCSVAILTCRSFRCWSSSCQVPPEVASLLLPCSSGGTPSPSSSSSLLSSSPLPSPVARSAYVSCASSPARPAEEKTTVVNSPRRRADRGNSGRNTGPRSCGGRCQTHAAARARRQCSPSAGKGPRARQPVPGRWA